MTFFIVLFLAGVVVYLLVDGSGPHASRVAQSPLAAAMNAAVRYDYTYVDPSHIPTAAFGVWDYLAQDGVTRFQFELQQDGRTVRIYILSSPSYGFRARDDFSTHRLTDLSGRKYICITGSLAPTDTREAVGWMTYWAEQTVEYIRTGRSFA